MLTTVAAGILGVHILVKFAFFAVPYHNRRAALDKSYAGKSWATANADPVLLAVTVALAALCFWRGVEPVSFLGGLWVGATLIQLYFHRFHAPVPADRAAPPPTSPLKEMSYAIQDAPRRAWPVLTILVVTSLVSLVNAR